MELDLGTCRVRSWRAGDEAALARHANSRKLWRNVRDYFPHPYTLADAQRWLGEIAGASPETNFAIEVNGEAGGGIGVILQQDVNRRSAEIGYWLGEAFWGRGVMTEVVRAFTGYAYAAYDLNRLYARVFAWNVGSARVLEKAGYTLEGRLRQAAVKEGEVVDELLYAALRDG